MNPRQRRGVLFMLLAGLLGIVVFVMVAGYTSNVTSEVGSKITVYQAKSQIPAYTELTRENLQAVEVPERWTSTSSRQDLSELVGRKIGFAVDGGTVISSDMLLAVSDLNPNEREIAINVDPVTGIGGRVTAGDRVDIYAVFADVNGLAKQVKVLVRDVRVVSIGGQQTVTKSDDNGVGQSDVIPVTLALKPADALAVTYANAFAQEVRLVGLPTDENADRSGEKDEYDAKQLGGRAVPEDAN
ncbi:Flp pilus assembly protein CpaB [Kineosporia sp. J2-2]|uniref:Flp pilus assembly protein CpaB n=1 Tax=Kineosporia corallincola TaxID=2835133 RepID=A0ABS5TR43_9ACTN|nr:Flp pilus assembly protein CpaB [Kineosporia corallincola]MBT0772629.1 Flp pilus assembly protein CpaB [Kineosporia corallincola]